MIRSPHLAFIALLTCALVEALLNSQYERFFLDGEQDWDETACMKHSPLCELWLCVMSAESAVSVKWAQYVAAKCDRRVGGNIWSCLCRKAALHLFVSGLGDTDGVN